MVLFNLAMFSRRLCKNINVELKRRNWFFYSTWRYSLEDCVKKSIDLKCLFLPIFIHLEIHK